MGPRQGNEERAQARRRLRDCPACVRRSHALVELDRIEGGEQRWQTLGLVGGVLLLLVAHTVQDEDENEVDEVIRIISARRADRKEKRRYEKEYQKSRGW